MSYRDDHEVLIRNSDVVKNCEADCDHHRLCNEVGQMLLRQCLEDGLDVNSIVADISCLGKVDGECGATVELDAFDLSGEKITDVTLQSVSAYNRFQDELQTLLGGPEA